MTILGYTTGSIPIVQRDKGPKLGDVGIFRYTSEDWSEFASLSGKYCLVTFVSPTSFPRLKYGVKFRPACLSKNDFKMVAAACLEGLDLVEQPSSSTDLSNRQFKPLYNIRLSSFKSWLGSSCAPHHMPVSVKTYYADSLEEFGAQFPKLRVKSYLEASTALTQSNGEVGEASRSNLVLSQTIGDIEMQYGLYEVAAFDAKTGKILVKPKVLTATSLSNAELRAARLLKDEDVDNENLMIRVKEFTQ